MHLDYMNKEDFSFCLEIMLNLSKSLVDLIRSLMERYIELSILKKRIINLSSIPKEIEY